VSAAELHASATDVVELAALRGREQDLAALAEGRHVRLPPLGQVVVAEEQIALSVRPGRWLLLTPPAAPGAAANRWRATCNGAGIVVDLSSGLTAFRITDQALCDAFARGCRLDLDPQVFPAGRAAATIVAQVSVILARLAGGMLLLTPSTTARHFREWLGEQVR
jgi:heterotetrameric sarcosine oxidase gamma subunit